MKPLVLKLPIIFITVALAPLSLAAPDSEPKYDREQHGSANPVEFSQDLASVHQRVSFPLKNQCFEEGASLQKKALLDLGMMSHQRYICTKEDDETLLKEMIFDQVYSLERGTIVMKQEERNDGKYN